MKKLKIQNISKQIICIIIILMLCNFIIPNYAYAKDEGGGVLLEAVAQFLCFLPDTVINCLQDMFISTDEIDDTATGEYKILYGPATIFAGEIPAFDINFINPKGEFKESVNLVEDAIVIGGGTTELEIKNDEYNNNYKDCGSLIDIADDLISGKGVVRKSDGKLLKLKGEVFNKLSDTRNPSEDIYVKDICEILNIELKENSKVSVNEKEYSKDEKIVINEPMDISDYIFFKNIRYNRRRVQFISKLYNRKNTS